MPPQQQEADRKSGPHVTIEKCFRMNYDNKYVIDQSRLQGLPKLIEYGFRRGSRDWGLIDE